MRHQRVRSSGVGLLFVAVLGLCLGAGEARAQLPSTAVASGAPDQGNNRVEAALLTDVAQVKAGDTFRSIGRMEGLLRGGELERRGRGGPLKGAARAAHPVG